MVGDVQSLFRKQCLDILTPSHVMPQNSAIAFVRVYFFIEATMVPQKLIPG